MDIVDNGIRTRVCGPKRETWVDISNMALATDRRDEILSIADERAFLAWVNRNSHVLKCAKKVTKND